MPLDTRNSLRKGVALIIVLAILVLVTALVVGFLVRTGSERAAAASYRATARTRQLADMVVNLVQAQINQATVAATSGSGSAAAWASQPGAIRVFDNLGNQTIYKLYSSGTMVTSNYNSIAGDMPPPGTSSATSWINSPSLWVDLNAPAAFTLAGSPALAYPIIDPRNPNGGDFTTGTSLPGFQVDLSQIGLTENPNLPAAPMPTQWLYVLQDGTIVPPDPTQSTGTSVILTAPNVSATNPIVGRIAFWTDDDTCRLNINTAGDGTFWDTPHYTAPDEWVLGFFSPAEYEYQRYPGHPATTSLLPVLSAVNPAAFPPNPSYWTTYSMQLPTPSASAYPFYSPINPYLQYSSVAGSNSGDYAYQNLFSLTPQYAYGGSEEATVPQNVIYQGYGGTAATSVSAPLNNQRLYPSVGEMLFSSTGASGSPPVRGATNGVTGAPLLTRQQLETAKFFLTAHSRAPELTLFGTPRVSIWPLTIGNSLGVTAVTLSGTQVVPASIRNTPTDQLLAFAATISGSSISPYYFMRNTNSDPYTDFSITENGAPQNQQLLAYLDDLMSMPIPGFSTSSFYNKYTQTGSRQILTEIMDYIRTIDTEDGTVIQQNGANGINLIYGLQNGGNGNYGHVVPTLNSMWASTSGTLQGFGTFARPTCVTIHFVALGNGPIVGSGTSPAVNIPPQQFGYPYYSHDPSITGTTATYPSSSGGTVNGTAGVVPLNTIAVQAFIYVQFVIPAAARIDSNSPVFGITMSGLDTLTLNGTTSLGFPASTGTTWYQMNLGGGVGGSYGNDQYTGPLPIFGETNWGSGGNDGRSSGPGNAGNTFSFYSRIITLPYVGRGAHTMTLGGGNNIVMKLLDASPAANVIQTVNLNFDQTSQSLPYPVNQAATAGSVDTDGTDPYTSGAGDFLSVSRIIGTGDYVSGSSANWPINTGDLTTNDRWMEGGPYLIDPYHDVMASLVLSSSTGWDDPRMLAIPNVPATAFVPHENWGQQMAHDLTYNELFTPFPGNSGSGKLVANATYGSALPCVESSETNGIMFSGGNIGGQLFGDWDNGVSFTSDGPWINRADEGGASTGAVYPNDPNYYYLPYFTGGNGGITMGPGIFSPNREIPSPVMFGSLPTGVPAGLAVNPNATPAPWQSLLFRPGAAINHPGRGQPTEGHPPYTVVPDHLLLDFFWMPVAEPYAISEPFSTAGKVNLNYQILPFGYVSAATGTTPYIKRNTGVRSALESLKIAAVPLAAAKTYKSLTGGNWWGQWGNVNTFPGVNGGNIARLPIDVNQTLQQFDSIFATGGFFQSASEICDVYLVPQGFSLSNFIQGPGNAGSWYGSDFAMVGNNVRDRPYADIYSRVTTKSNTFTVYFTVQELKNPPSARPNQWNESTGSVVGEYRGSVDLERYIQQNASIPNFLANPAAAGSVSLESDYRWRVLENNQFAP